MKGFDGVSEIFTAPPPGTYPVMIIDGEAKLSKKGNSMIELKLEVIEGKYLGSQFSDWLLTDPSAKGAGASRTKLRILLQGTPYNGLADASANNEVPDEVIVQSLKGQRLFVIIDNSPRRAKDGEGNLTDQTMTQVDPATGKLVEIMNADVKGYTRHAVAQQPVQPQFQQAPQQPVQQVIQAQPQQVIQAQPQQVIQQAQPQFAPPQQQFIQQQPVQQIAPQPVQQIAPQQFIQQPMQTAPQQQFVQQGAPAGAPGVAVPPWQAQSNGAAGAEQPAAGKGRGKKAGQETQAQG